MILIDTDSAYTTHIIISDNSATIHWLKKKKQNEQNISWNEIKISLTEILEIVIILCSENMKSYIVYKVCVF